MQQYYALDSEIRAELLKSWNKFSEEEQNLIRECAEMLKEKLMEEQENGI